MWMEVDEQNVPKGDPVLHKFAQKQQNQNNSSEYKSTYSTENKQRENLFFTIPK